MAKEINQRVATIFPASATIKIGDTQTFTLSGTNATIQTFNIANGRCIIYSQSSTSITIQAMAEGQDYLNIILTDNTSLSIQITIVSTDSIPNPPTPSVIPVTGIECDEWDVALNVNETRQMHASVIPSNATNQLIHWSSSATDIATVSSNGLITAKSVGYAKVTAVTDDGGYPYDVHVNVTSNTTTPEPTPPVTPNPPANKAPSIGVVLVSNETSNGGFTLTYTASDPDGDTLTHKLKLDNGAYSSIHPTQNGNNYTYNGGGLNTGTHTGQIQVSDGRLTTESAVFNIVIRAQATGAKAELKEAKEVYDQKHNALKTTINTIISDGAFDKETESAQLNQAFTDYNKALAKFKKVAQKAIDAIAEAKKNEAIDESKTYTNAQIKVVNDAITMSVTKVEEIQTTTNQSIANINSALNKVNADLTNSNNTINGVIGDINDLDQTVEGVLNNVNTVITNITQLEKRVQSAEQKVTAEAITSVVSGTYATKTDVTAQINGVTQTVTSVQERVNKAEQKITDSAIISTVTSSQTYRDNLSDKVSTNQVISSINQTAERVKISASKIDLQGYITASDLSGTSSTTIDGSNISTGVIKSRDGSFWFDLNNSRMAIYDNNRLLGITHKMRDNSSGKYGLGFQANSDSFIALALGDNDDNTIYKPYIALTKKAFGEYKAGINLLSRVEMNYNTLSNGALSYNGFRRNSGDYVILYSSNNDSSYSKLIMELGNDNKTTFEINHKFYNKSSVDRVASFRAAGGSDSDAWGTVGINFYQHLSMNNYKIWGATEIQSKSFITVKATIEELSLQPRFARFNLDDIKYTATTCLKENVEFFATEKLTDGYCKVELPVGFIHAGYIVNISPHESGRYQIIKYDDYFEVVGDIGEFDYIIKGAM